MNQVIDYKIMVKNKVVDNKEIFPFEKENYFYKLSIKDKVVFFIYNSVSFFCE